MVFLVNNVALPAKGISLEEPCARVFFNQTDLGDGVIYFTQRCLIWRRRGSHEGFCVDYNYIYTHKVSLDANSFTVGVAEFNKAGSQTPGNPSDDGDMIITELRFIPENMLGLARMKETLEIRISHLFRTSDSDSEDSTDDDKSSGGYTAMNGSDNENDSGEEQIHSLAVNPSDGMYDEQVPSTPKFKEPECVPTAPSVRYSVAQDVAGGDSFSAIDECQMNLSKNELTDSGCKECSGYDSSDESGSKPEPRDSESFGAESDGKADSRPKFESKNDKLEDSGCNSPDEWVGDVSVITLATKDETEGDAPGSKDDFDESAF